MFHARKQSPVPYEMAYYKPQRHLFKCLSPPPKKKTKKKQQKTNKKTATKNKQQNKKKKKIEKNHEITHISLSIIYFDFQHSSATS